MKSIGEIIDGLTELERSKLMYAFEHVIEQFIPIGDGRYVGVHCKDSKLLKSEHEAGYWSTGRILNEDSSVRS